MTHPEIDTVARREFYSVTEVADLVGIGRSTVRKAIVRGKLRAVDQPGSKPDKIHRKLIPRAELVRWLVSGGFPLDHLRAKLNEDGVLMLVATPPALRAALADVWTVPVPGLFQLGLQLNSRRVWGVVVDLPAVGTVHACRSLAEFGALADRPHLVGLYGEDGIPAAEADPFDTLLPRAIEADALARTLRRLKPAP